MPPNFFEIADNNLKQIEAALTTFLAKARKGGKADTEDLVDFLYLRGWYYIGHIQTSKALLVVAKPLSKPSGCPKCGGPPSEFNAHGWTERRCVKDEQRGLLYVRIYFQMQRYLCRGCGELSQQPTQGLAEHRRMTERLLNLIHKGFFRYSIADLKRQTGVGEQTLHNIFTDYAEELIRTIHFETPHRMGIDGKYINGVERCVITDLDKGCPVAILEECNYAALSRFFIQMPHRERVELVAMDMTRTFAAVVYRWLPRAGIVIDTYHFQRKINEGLHEALRELRKEERLRKLVKDHRKKQRENTKPQKGEIRRTRFLLFKRSSDLTEAERKVLDEWIKEIPQLGIWYDLKEKFLNIFQLLDGEKAERRYDEWELLVQQKLPGAFKELRTAMRNWRRAIFNYFNGRVTNALTEAINGRIEEVQQRGRSYKFEVVKALILYAEYRPPRRSKKKRRLKPRPPNPRAKVERLRRAFTAQDKTLGLIPDPKEKEEWLRHFDEVLQWLATRRDEMKRAYKKRGGKSKPGFTQGHLFSADP